MELHTKSSWQHPSPLQLLSILPWFLYLWSHLTTGVSEGPFIPLFICPSLVFLFLSPYFLGFSHHVLELVLHPYDQLTFPSNSRRFVPSLCLTPLFIRIFTCIFSNSWQWSRLGLVLSLPMPSTLPPPGLCICCFLCLEHCFPSYAWLASLPPSCLYLMSGRTSWPPPLKLQHKLRQTPVFPVPSPCLTLLHSNYNF